MIIRVSWKLLQQRAIIRHHKNWQKKKTVCGSEVACANAMQMFVPVVSQSEGCVFDSPVLLCALIFVLARTLLVIDVKKKKIIIK